MFNADECWNHTRLVPQSQLHDLKPHKTCTVSGWCVIWKGTEICWPVGWPCSQHTQARRSQFASCYLSKSDGFYCFSLHIVTRCIFSTGRISNLFPICLCCKQGKKSGLALFQFANSHHSTQQTGEAEVLNFYMHRMSYFKLEKKDPNAEQNCGETEYFSKVR